MLTWLGYIDGIHGAPYIAAPLGPWIRHGHLEAKASGKIVPDPRVSLWIYGCRTQAINPCHLAIFFP